MGGQICVSDEDAFSAAAVRNARAVDDRLRELAPAVKLSRENITLVTRYQHVAMGLRDWKVFSSTSRPWHDPNSVRPELLLTDDPPKHTAVRAVIAAALSAKALARMAEAFRADAEALVLRFREKSGTLTRSALSACSRSSINWCAPTARWFVRRLKRVCAGIRRRAWPDVSPRRMWRSKAW